ncbi:MAG: hypothetical protein PHX65_08745 [Sulfurimonas sp.]|nr:hypothetical protein [Sulfurimonas sp.]
MIRIWILYVIHMLTILLLQRKITGSSEEWVSDNYPDGDGSLQIVNSYDYYIEPIVSNHFIFIALLTAIIPIIITLSYKEIIFFCHYNDECEEVCK